MNPLQNKRHVVGADFPAKRGPNGERLCRWCGEEVKKPRLTWCSQKCIDEYLLRARPAAMRAFVFARDKGICAICGRDTEKIRVQLERRLAAAWESMESAGRLRAVVWSNFLRRLGLTAGMFVLRHLWEADHIVPVVEGGGACGPENMRTACVPCHKGQTTALARRRAEARRKTQAARNGELFDSEEA
jgi:5-methylcytosine-specific restriction protein A